MRVQDLLILDASLYFVDPSIYIKRVGNDMILSDVSAGSKTLSELVGGGGSGVSQSYVDGSLATRDASINSNFLVRTDNFDPNGFVDPFEDVSVAFIDASRTLQITPIGSSYVYYSDGLRYEKSSLESIQISDVEGMHYVYFDGSIITHLASTFNPDIILKKCYIGAIYWDASNNKQNYFGREYRHTSRLDGKTHEYLHNTVGYALKSGGGLGDFLADQSGALLSHAQFSNEATEAYDEDAYFSLPARLSTSIIPVIVKITIGTNANANGNFYR